MKKQTRKLVLCRETLRALDEGKLEKVFGASDGSDGQACAGSYCLNCPTFVFTCTTNSVYC